jgi:stage II sporulation protein P
MRRGSTNVGEVSPIKRRIWISHPLLVAYVVVVSTTIGLLVRRSPGPEEAVPAMASAGHLAVGQENEAAEAPLWLQLFRPSPPTAQLLLRMALPSLPFARAEQGPRNLLILWTGQAGDQPQTLFQAMLPFLRPQGQVAGEVPAPKAPQSEPQKPGPAEAGSAEGSTAAKPPATNPAEGAAQGQAQPNGQQGKAPAAPRPASTVALNGGLPLVGIYHTHDYESYISEFPDLKITHARDLNKVVSYDHGKRTVVKIGESLAHRLRDLGVTTVHAPFKHQDLGYDYAYQSSRATARQIMRTAPSVRVLMDLHRDGTLGLDATTVIDGQKVARIRCVIGNREDQPAWSRNKAFCDDLIARMDKAHPGLTLPTLTAPYRYNQDLMPGAILLEIGNATNGYDEADRAIRFLAETLVAMIKDGAYPQ